MEAKCIQHLPFCELFVKMGTLSSIWYLQRLLHIWRSKGHQNLSKLTIRFLCRFLITFYSHFGSKKWSNMWPKIDQKTGQLAFTLPESPKEAPRAPQGPPRAPFWAFWAPFWSILVPFGAFLTTFGAFWDNFLYRSCDMHPDAPKDPLIQNHTKKRTKK